MILLDKDIKEKSSLYMSLTNEMKNSLLKDDFLILEELFNKRQGLIDYYIGNDFLAKEFAKAIKESDIVTLEEEVGTLIEDKKSKIKASMEELLISKNANQKYKSQFSVDPIFFNKKI